LLVGRFEIVSAQGRGQYGCVYKALDTQLQTYVAIKVLNSALHNSEQAISSFKNELLLVRQLSHPNIIRVHEYYFDQQLHFITMDWIEGLTLEDKIAEKKLTSQEIIDIVKKNGGQAVLTSDKHYSGSDRIHEAYLKNLESKVDLIINLQGDMPNIKPHSISKLEKLMRNNSCDIGTLASDIKNKEELNNENVVKLQVDDDLNNDNFLQVRDFFRKNNVSNNKKIYHHIGIYAFTRAALTQYVQLSRSKLEIERNLEQMRAMENKMVIKTGFSDSYPLGVDTEEDLVKVTKEMNL